MVCGAFWAMETAGCDVCERATGLRAPREGDALRDPRAGGLGVVVHDPDLAAQEHAGAAAGLAAGEEGEKVEARYN